MTVSEQIETLNQHLKETDAIYHSAAVRFGLSDSAFWILYAIADSQRTYTQNELCGAWSYSKQTVNSAIQSLIRQGVCQAGGRVRHTQQQDGPVDRGGQSLFRENRSTPLGGRSEGLRAAVGAGARDFSQTVRKIFGFVPGGGRPDIAG